jgi:hypothetical protein
VESDHEVDREVLREIAEALGAVVMGRRLFDVVDGPYGWSDEMGYGLEHATTPPFFVVTTRRRRRFGSISTSRSSPTGWHRRSTRPKQRPATRMSSRWSAAT